MPQIRSTPTDSQNVLKERIPSGTSRSSDELRQSALHLIGKSQIRAGTGEASGILYEAAVRTAEAFYFGSPGGFFSVRDIKEVAREEILPTLIEISNLLMWSDNWNSYGACAPKYTAVQYADHWIELFYHEIMNSGQEWLEPNVTASAEGEVVFEWRHGIKKLTIYIDNQNAEYVKDWGADINTEMEDGYANSPRIRRTLWQWLMS